MPPAASIAMPTQDLRRPAPQRWRFARSPRVLVARAMVFGGAAVLTLAAAYEMAMVVAAGGTTPLEAAMTILFVITFGWIALAATSAVAAVTVAPVRRWPAELRPLTTRTALIMPIFHEDPVETTLALAVMARGLAEEQQAHAFEIIVLSDSTGADEWVKETVAVDHLRATLGPTMPVWYRRRWSNDGKKAGNVRDFVEHWGGRYDHFITLDADSLMAPTTLVLLALAMEDDPQLGLLQTVPTLIDGRSLFARMQQFAGRIYGPIVARGLAAWQGEDGNYWGHNAIIRTSAFAETCGLPTLAGRPPFGGAILSHDFVEAALLRRCGWKVEMTPDLRGSWEKGPPSLTDALVRDRRWAQGNLQHLKVIGAAGLRWPSRANLAIGIMSYVASPVWLLLILFGFALATQTALFDPEYFPSAFQLFPSWPLFDSERMVRLFLATTTVLLTPKAIGLAVALTQPELRRASGGGLRLCLSALVELVLSALYAPVIMAVHSRDVAAIVTGAESGWLTQRRKAERGSWREAARRHGWHTTVGVATAAATWWLLPDLLPWVMPTLAGLILAIPLARMSGSVRIGSALGRLKLLATPEDTAPHECLRACLQGCIPLPLPADGILALATDTRVREAHFRLAGPLALRRGAPDPAYLTAAQKIAEASNFYEAMTWLDPRERVHVAGQPLLIDRLLQLRTAPQGAGAAAEPALVLLSGAARTG